MHAILGRLPPEKAEAFAAAHSSVEVWPVEDTTAAYLAVPGVSEADFAILRAKLTIFASPPPPVVEKIDETASFGWVYWAGEAEADEIQWSIRSVLKYYRGNAKITVIGDRPRGFNGHVISQPRVAPQRLRAYRDTLNKLLTLVRSPELTANRVWMMDDIYFMRPFTLQDLATPLRMRHSAAYGAADWLQVQLDTAEAIRASGREYVNHVAHCPIWIDIPKFEETVAYFSLESRVLTWESCYGVMHFPDAAVCDTAVLRVQGRKVTAPDCERARQRLILNHAHNCWSPELAAWLALDLADYGQELFDG